MNWKRGVAIALFLFSTIAVASERRYDEDLTDLWWNPNESGWGMQVTQAGAFAFASLYVYGPDGAPVWYTAQLNREYAQFMNGYEYTGPLYSTRGPWLGGTFDPAIVNIRRVGSMKIYAPINGANGLAYDVDGVQVYKVIYRQPLPDNRGAFIGFYSNVSVKIERFSCPQPDDRVHSFNNQFFVVSKGLDLEVSWLSAPFVCKFAGPYYQAGRIGSFTGNYSCTDGEVGTAIFYELAGADGLFTGRWRGHSDSNACEYEIQFAGVRTSCYDCR